MQKDLEELTFSSVLVLWVPASLAEVSGIRWVGRQEHRMHPLCFLSLSVFISNHILHDLETQGLLIGPFMLSFESTCGKAERPLALFAKTLHLAAW